MTRKKITLSGVQESQRFLDFESAFHKAGFIILLCLILSAISGLFSGGYLSEAKKTNIPGSATVIYERFGRLQTEFKLNVTVHSHQSGQYILRIGGDFNQYYELGNIWPLPDSMYSQNDEIYLVYTPPENNTNMSIGFFVTPLKPGKAVSTIQLNNEPEIRFWQFIYP